MIDAVLKKLREGGQQIGTNVLNAPSTLANNVRTGQLDLSGGVPSSLQALPHLPLIQSQAQYVPLEQLQAMPQINPYATPEVNMGLMELLEQAAQMR